MNDNFALGSSAPVASATALDSTASMSQDRATVQKHVGDVIARTWLARSPIRMGEIVDGYDGHPIAAFKQAQTLAKQGEAVAVVSLIRWADGGPTSMVPTTPNLKGRTDWVVRIKGNVTDASKLRAGDHVVTLFDSQGGYKGLTAQGSPFDTLKDAAFWLK